MGMWAREARTFVRGKGRVLARLLGWSLVEAGQTFLLGFALARALDEGFLKGQLAVGLGWLAAGALSIAVGAYGTGRVYRAVAGLVEPLRDELVRRVVARGLRDADGFAVSRLTHQVEIARDTFAGLVMVSRSFVFVAAGALAGLFSLAPALLVVVVPPLVLGLGLFLLSLRPMARRQETFLVADEAISQEVGAAVAGLRDITASGAERRVAHGAQERFGTEVRAATSLARWGMCRVLALGVGGRLPVVLLLVATPWLLARGVTAGALVGALAYLTQSLLPALQALMQGLGTAGTRLGVVLRRLMVQGEGPGGTGAPPAPWPRTDPGTAVALQGVTFAYGPHAEPVLREVDLTVPAGGHLAVVGPSGIGKSTLAALIAGLLTPDSGEIRTAGPATSLARAADGGVPESAAARRVLVPQEAYVFSGTVRENLAYLCPHVADAPDSRGEGTPPPAQGPSDAAIRASAEAVGARELLDRLGGLDAQLAPAALSAGERQLIALARAHLAPVPLVVLDEATCHLDPAAEARAERAFAARPGGTLIVVAHRISSALRAERILVMDGAHALCGRHRELLERSALYRDLAGDWGEGAVKGPDAGADRGASNDSSAVMTKQSDDTSDPARAL